jgi:hypothetical protein
VALPVRLAGGTGNTDIRLQWDSKGLLASAVCGDTDATKAVTGGVIPQDYVLKGAFRIASVGEAMDQAWQAVQEVVKAQRAGCEAVLNKIDIQEILGRIAGKGFNVKIPKKIFKNP